MPNKKAVYYYNIGILYAFAGEREKAERIFNELLEGKEIIPDRWLFIAEYYIAFKEYDKVLECLERGFKERDSGMIWIKTDFLFDPLRSNPRFKALLKKMGFPE